MKNIKLKKEEKEILKELESDNFKSVFDKNKDSLKYAEIAKKTLKKNKSITIRIAEKDLQKIKAKAAEQGIPYQTFITSMIHKNIYS